jgi:hypothetical protein
MTQQQPNTQQAPGAAGSRRRKVNNLTQSLGRMAHVKSKTLAWLKLYEKGRSRDTPSAVSLHAYPSVHALQPCAAPLPPIADAAAALSIPSPLTAWAPELHPPVPFACSFCASRMPHHAVSFNLMLPAPYVLTCEACAAGPSAPKK